MWRKFIQIFIFFILFFYLLKVNQTVAVLFCLFYFGILFILFYKFWVNFYFRTTNQGCLEYREQRLTFPGSQVKPTCAFQREDKLKQCGPCTESQACVCLCVLAVLSASVNVLWRCVSRLAEESGLCKFSFSKVSRYSLASTPERECSQIIPIYVSVQTKANICACVWLMGQN